MNIQLIAHLIIIGVLIYILIKSIQLHNQYKSERDGHLRKLAESFRRQNELIQEQSDLSWAEAKRREEEYKEEIRKQ
jgi:hypothetical protein